MRITISSAMATLIALSVLAGFMWDWKCGIFVFLTPIIIDVIEKVAHRNG